MLTNTLSRDDSRDTTDAPNAETTDDVETRTRRALEECMTVLPGDGETFTVVGQNGGSEYSVDTAGTCTCADAEYNLSGGETCKHVRRMEFATGRRPIPVGDLNVDEQLGAHVETRVATDGGEDGGECEECAGLPGAFPCADCYIDGEKELPERRESDAGDDGREVAV